MMCLHLTYYYIITHGDHKHVTKSAFGNHKYKTSYMIHQCETKQYITSRPYWLFNISHPEVLINTYKV